jgi:para-nitrobenzyl esterase
MAALGEPTYLYQFTRVLPGGEALGAFHASEISYVFGVKLPWLPREPVDDTLSDAMGGYWARFATTGDPNGSAAPRWPGLASGRDGYLELGSTIRAGADLKREACDLMEPAIVAPWKAPTSR